MMQAGLEGVAKIGSQPKEEGWHFSCERGCTRDDYGTAGPFLVERLKMDLPFVNVLCAHSEVPALLPKAGRAGFLQLWCRPVWRTQRLVVLGVVWKFRPRFPVSLLNIGPDSKETQVSCEIAGLLTILHPPSEPRGGVSRFRPSVVSVKPVL